MFDVHSIFLHLYNVLVNWLNFIDIVNLEHIEISIWILYCVHVYCNLSWFDLTVERQEKKMITKWRWQHHLIGNDGPFVVLAFFFIIHDKKLKRQIHDTSTHLSWRTGISSPRFLQHIPSRNIITWKVATKGKLVANLVGLQSMKDSIFQPTQELTFKLSTHISLLLNRLSNGANC